VMWCFAADGSERRRDASEVTTWPVVERVRRTSAGADVRDLSAYWTTATGVRR